MVLLTIADSFASSKTSNCNEPTASTQLDVNNVRALLMNGGDKFWDIFKSQRAGYEIPKGSGKTACFASAIWLAGIDAGQNLYTAGQTYRQVGEDFWSGTLNNMGQTNLRDCDEANKMYSVYGSEIINTKNGKEISYNVSRWPSAHAPFFDANNDGIYDPSLGDYPVLDVNNPSLIPGQMVFWTINDMGNDHIAFINNNRLGVEIHNTAYAFESNNSEIINNSTIYRYKIINKSNNVYTDFRFGEFADFDLGSQDDDYIGCDLSTNVAGKKRNLFYVYNSDNNDGDGQNNSYGSQPPAFGMCFLNTGKNSNGTSLDMHSYIYVTPNKSQGLGGPPNEPRVLRWYLLGLFDDSTGMTYGTATGQGGTEPYKFIYPGDTDPNGKPMWVETGPKGDRKVIASIQSRTFEPGEQMVVEVAYLWARDPNGNHLGSLEKLRRSSDTVINAYSNNFMNFSTGISNLNKLTFNIYPNPLNNVAYIEADFKINLIQIYNMQGRLMKEIKNTNTRKIDLEELPEGNYIIKINNISKKFIKL